MQQVYPQFFRACTKPSFNDDCGLQLEDLLEPYRDCCIKQAVLDCCALHYLDATKYLVFETDASNTGWCYVLYLFNTKDYIIEPIM